MIFKKTFLLVCTIILISQCSQRVFKRSYLSQPVDNKTILPKGYLLPQPKKKVLKTKHLSIHVFSKSFSQGDAIYIEILPKSTNLLSHLKQVEVFFNSNKVLLTHFPWGLRGLKGISPTSKIGVHFFEISYTYNNKKFTQYFKIKIKKTHFPVSKKKMIVKKLSRVPQKTNPKITAFIKKNRKIKAKANALNTEDFLDHLQSHPRSFHYITSEFWKKRITSRFKYKKKHSRKSKTQKIHLKPKISRHTGLDFKGKIGAPVYAMGSGYVAIAEKMYYEGNYILINHGHKTFTGYMHLSKTNVKVNDFIKAGDKIGEVGATGTVTGPHLHVFMKIQGELVNPLSFLSLPIRN